MIAHGLWSVLWIAALTVPCDSMLPTTTPPIIYTIDYSDQCFTKPESIERFRAAPPDLLHLGKAVPITHLWGPVDLYAAENQYTGKPGRPLDWGGLKLDLESIVLLTPETLTQRVEHIRDTLARLHAAGVREITPYICFITLAGDHEKRLGFWDFYDHWDRYARWAGSRLPHDPFDWTVRGRDGKYPAEHCGYPYSPPYFAPLHRYNACINHPDWQEWHRRLIRMIAQVGYDGCFIDNSMPLQCYCSYCKTLFSRFLTEHHDIDWVHRLTSGLKADQVALDSRQLPPELARRWRVMRVAEHLAMLRRTGREAKADFTIFPNGNDIQNCLAIGSECDRLMFEGTSSPGLSSADAPPAADEIVVHAVDGAAESDRYTHHYVLSDGMTSANMAAEIAMPMETQVGKPALFEVRVKSVGNSPVDDDAAEAFFLMLCDAESGAETRLELPFQSAIGGTGSSHRAKRPPVTLRAAWTPSRPGAYTVQLGFRYTDDAHGPQARLHPYLSTLTAGQLCVDHVGELLFTQHMRARPIYLAYEAATKGWENVQELQLAEMAAFSGGGGVSGNGRPQVVYRTFFKEHPKLFDGWQPTAPAAVLYAYWGINPLDPQRPTGQPTIHDVLAASHRPFVALIDASLPDRADDLAGFAVIYFASLRYEMSAEQLQAVRTYTRHGRIVLTDEDTTVNGRQVMTLFGSDRVVVWDPRKPTTPTAALIAPVQNIRKNLRFAVYQKPDRLAVHAVNYNVCLLDPQRKVLEVEATPLAIPVPSDWTAARATGFDPDAAATMLPCTVAEGVARLTLPKVHVYKIILLERR